MRRNRIVLILAVVVVLLVVSVTACRSRGAAEDAEADGPAAVRIGAEDTVVVTEESISSGPALSGTLSARNQATVRAQIAGSVLATSADVGVAVSEGTVLARLDPGALASQQQSARTTVTSAQISLSTAQKELSRQQVMAREGIVAKRDVEMAQQNVSQANAALAQARAQSSASGEQLSYAAVRAPMSGIISARQVSAGDVVQTGAVLFTLVDLSVMELAAAVPADQVGQVRVGMPMTFTVNGFAGRTFGGRITRINPSVDAATRQIEVFAEIVNPDRTLVSGVYAEGRVESASRVGLVVPAAAIDRRSSTPSVVRVRGNRVERVPVQLGVVDEKNGRVEIRSGVMRGDVVLAGAAQQLTPGTEVELPPNARVEPAR